MIKVKIEGLDEITAVLKDMPEKIQTKALTAGLKEAGREIRKSARDLAPRGSGKLRKNLKMVTLRRRAGLPAAVFVGFTKGAAKKLLEETGKKGKFPFYWIPQEYGWTDRAGNRHPGKAYLRGALQKHMETLKRAIAENVRKVIREYEAKAKR